MSKAKNMRLGIMLISLLLTKTALSQSRVDSLVEVVSDHLAATFYCDNGLCKGFVVEYYPNGQPKIQGKFRKGHPKHVTEFFDNGRLKLDRFYRKRRLVTSYSYLPSGQLSRKIDWKRRLDVVFFYDSSGRPIRMTESNIRDYSNIVTTTYLQVNGKWIEQ